MIRLTAGATVTEFVHSAARKAAERKLAEQRIWRRDAEAWNSFTAIFDAEPRCDVFISYAHADEPTVLRLVELISSRGARPHRCGREYARAIRVRTRSRGRPLHLNAPAAAELAGRHIDPREALGGAATIASLLAQLLGERAPVLRPDTLDGRAVRVSNRAAIFRPAPGPITRSLREDYAKLSQLTQRDIAVGPLGALLEGMSDPYAGFTGVWPNQSIGPATLAQNEAVGRAMTSVLTVVTGPPGTGKSQISPTS